MNSEGATGPLDQRDDFKEAKKTCNNLYREYAATARCGNTRIHPQEQVRQRLDQQFVGHEEDSYRRIQKLDGHIIFLQQPRPSDSWWTAWNWDSSSWNEQ